MMMPGRTYSVQTGYRYGFNGKENDNEVKGDGNQQDYGMRMYDPRIGKFLSVDPIGLSYPWYSPYHFAGNTPIQAIDLDGKEPQGYARDNPYGASHPGTNVTHIPSQYDNEGWLVSFKGEQKQLMHVYAIQDVDKRTYLIFETATGAKAQWYIEYDKGCFIGDVNSFTWKTPPDPTPVLYAMTLGPLVAVPAGMIYGAAGGGYIYNQTLNGIAKTYPHWATLGMAGNKALEILDESGSLAGANAGTRVLFNRISLFERYSEHIFSQKHIDEGILSLGNSKDEILKEIGDVIEQNISKLKEGYNTIQTKMNGIVATIKAFVQDGDVKSIDAFSGTSNRNTDNLINLINED